MSHKYPRGEFELPSVTTILGDVDGGKAVPLMQWSANMCVEWLKENYADIPDARYPTQGRIMIVPTAALDQARFAYKDVSQKALDIGSEVHAAIEVHLKAQLRGTLSYNFGKAVAKLSPQAANAFGAFLQWMDEHEVKPIALEQTVYGPHWAGMLDFVGWFNGKVYVVDWKTSKMFTKSMRYQVAAYRWACGESMLNNVIEGCGVLRIDKATGEPEWKDYSKSYEKDLKTFNAAVEFYMLSHPRIAKAAGWTS